jgi:hypothetical protein
LARVLSTDGTWRDGKAAPRLLDERLRGLPGDYVTRDPDRPDAIHDIDLEAQPHVIEEIVKDRVKAESATEQTTFTGHLDKLWAPGIGEKARVTQWFVDVTRTRVGLNLAKNRVQDVIEGKFDALWHLEFPDEWNVNEYGLRKGQQPHKRMRLKHLREIDTTIDILNPIPRSIQKALAERGVQVPNTDLRSVMEQIEKTERGSRLWLPT